MSIQDPLRFDSPVLLHFGPALARLSRDDFFEFCQANPELRLERTSDGDLIIMPPAGSDAGRRNLSIAGQLWLWSERDGTGVAFDSSAGFTLPNGAVRSPDAAWVLRDRWHAVPASQREKFAPIAPDFIVEIRSPSDSLKELRAKMREYVECGVRLAWLIDPRTRRVEIYRPGHKPATAKAPSELRGDPELPGLIVHLGDVFS